MIEHKMGAIVTKTSTLACRPLASWQGLFHPSFQIGKGSIDLLSSSSLLGEGQRQPQLGEIRTGLELGKANYSHKFIFSPCDKCHTARWVLLYKGKPRNRLCGSCNNWNSKHKREQHPNWKGGQIETNGYIFIYKPEHPHAKSKGYVKRARLVLEEKLGRYLLDEHEPHHINGIKDDDRPENLIELSHIAHAKLQRRSL